MFPFLNYHLDSDGINTKAKKLTKLSVFILNALYQHRKWIPCFAGYNFEKLSTGKLNTLSISKIIFHKVRGPVTCWEVVVHHLRPVYSLMDDTLLQTHWGT